MKQVNKRIKILFTIPNFITAGSGREMLNIIERLDKTLFESYICVQQAGGALFDEAKRKGYEVLVQDFEVKNATGMIATLRGARKLATTFKNYKFDIWQSFNWSSDYSEALVAKLSGAKHVYVKKNMNWDRAAWKAKSFLANQIVARNTTMFRAFFAPPYLRTKTHYIPGAVDIGVFKQNKNTEIRAEYNIPEDAYLVCCVAQLVRVKDQPTLIKAIADTDAYLILAGAARDDEYVAELYLLIESLQLKNRVIMTGAVNNVNCLLNASDAFVLPTTNTGGHEEGSPVALIEAMAAKLPCIASNVAGNRDLIQTNETGLLFAPNNIAELTACIEKYQNEPDYAKQMAANAYELVLNEHTLDIEAAAFEKLYKKMMRVKQ
ncbi:hypothetical protein CAP35_03705 [Chitinophagaceae bacterium IBVUCB1]|nr:hypothetical protein CAP35_03705 [Chitinophagaceae bacterium IBVUCB1]